MDRNNKIVISNPIMKIVIDYYRKTIIEVNNLPNEINLNSVVWEYSEQLVLDRKTNTILHTQNVGSNCKIERKYQVEGGIEGLLDGFENDLFSEINSCTDDEIKNSNEKITYVIRIEYEKGLPKIISGKYNKSDLPTDYAEFIEEIFDFMKFYGLGEIFNPRLYTKQNKKKDEVILLSVVFNSYSKEYYYLTEDDSIEIEDYIWVNTGSQNKKTIVQVVDKGYYLPEDLPVKDLKLKTALNKCTEEELKDFFEKNDF